MAKIPENVIKNISEQDIFPVATVSSDGVPNVIYVKYLRVADEDTVLIVDNYFDKTRKNLTDNGKLAFTVLDEKKGSYQIKGTAKWLTSGEYFDGLSGWVPQKYPKVAVAVLNVEEVYNGAELLSK